MELWNYSINPELFGIIDIQVDLKIIIINISIKFKLPREMIIAASWN